MNGFKCFHLLKYHQGRHTVLNLEEWMADRCVSLNRNADSQVDGSWQDRVKTSQVLDPHLSEPREPGLVRR